MLGLCAASIATVWLQCSLGTARGARADLPLPPFGRLTQTWRKRGANPLALGPEHKLLGDLVRIAARTATDCVRAILNEPELSVGIALCIQTHGSLLNWQPHIHALVTDGGFRPDGSFVRLPAHATDALTEAFRRHVLYFIARLVAHIPDKDQVLQRYYGYYANRARGERRKAAWAPEAEPVAAEIDAATSRSFEPALAEAATVEPANFSRADARRWAVLITRIYEVDPLVCPKCGGTMRVIALIQEPKVIDKILKHLRTKGRDARAGPWATAERAG